MSESEGLCNWTDDAGKSPAISAITARGASIRRSRDRLTLSKRSLSALLRSRYRDARGTAVIEFALVAAPLFALMIAIFETGLTYFTQEALETAAEQAARSLMTGQAQSAAQTQAQFTAAACKGLPAYMNCNNLIVDVETAPSFAAINTNPPTITFDNNGNVTNHWSFSPVSGDNIVILRLMYLWPVANAPLGFTLANASSTQRLLIATTVFKAEHYA